MPEPDPDTETDLLHFVLPSGYETGELEYYIEVDPLNTITESDETNNRFPDAGTETMAFNERATLEITIVPVIWNRDGEILTVDPLTLFSFFAKKARSFK